MSAYQCALERLLSLERFGVRPGLERMVRLLERFDHPERAFEIVHIAGTNGKGSTAAMVESMLRAGGQKTGLYTSPHLLRFTERIKVGGQEISEAEVAQLAEEVLTHSEDATFFEVVTTMALLAFRRHGVKWAVLEAGLGGRLDATNVIEAPRVTVVTGVALDHTEVLGKTLPEIAREKAGIFKAGRPAVIGVESDDARAVLLAEAARISAPSWLRGRDFSLTAIPGGLHYEGPGGPLDLDRIGLVGAHQTRNAALALAAVGLAAPELEPDARRRALVEVHWPGRLERLAPDLLVDAAHNPDGARALAAALPEQLSGRPMILILGMLADKDAETVLAILAPLADRLILTRPASPRARDPHTLARAGAEVIDPPAEALSIARARAQARNGVVVVTGSTFLVGEVRRLALGESKDPVVAQDPSAQKL